MPTISEAFRLIPEDAKEMATELLHLAESASILTSNVIHRLQSLGRDDLLYSGQTNTVLGQAAVVSCITGVRDLFGTMEAIQDAAEKELLSTPKAPPKIKLEGKLSASAVFENLMETAPREAVDAADKIATAAMIAVDIANKTFLRLFRDGIQEGLDKAPLLSLFGKAGFLVNYGSMQRYFSTVADFHDAVYEEAKEIIRASAPNAPKVVH